MQAKEQRNQFTVIGDKSIPVVVAMRPGTNPRPARNAAQTFRSTHELNKADMSHGHNHEFAGHT